MVVTLTSVFYGLDTHGVVPSIGITSISSEHAGNAGMLGPTIGFQNQNLQCNKIPGRFMCFEKFCSQVLLLIFTS